MDMFKKLNKFLNIFMGAFIGVFIGRSLYIYWDYNKYPALYEMQSAPWYTSIQVYAAATGGIVVLALLIKFFIRNK